MAAKGRRLSPTVIGIAREYMQRNGCTQKALAFEIGTHTGNMSKWLAGHRVYNSEPTPRAIVALCDLLGVDPAEAVIDTEAT